MSFAVDARVFVKHPKKSWLPGFVTSRDAKTGKYVVTDDEHDEVDKVVDDHITLCREDLLNEGVDPVVHDLLFLTVLHDATLLRCLKVRYMKDIIYTNIGAIVVALNPFNFKIPWYLDSAMDKYLEEGDTIRTNLPHSWAVAHNTYFEMLGEGRAQTILVSGESGAGKTEACKMVLKYLGSISMLKATDEQRDSAERVREKIQQASPILEGFGNAKTVRNNNSSRFGKFVKIKFADEGYLSGAFTINYLLEKSRIVTCSPNERVYHALYLICKGKDANSLNLKGAAEYRSTNAGKNVNIEGVDDAADYKDVLDAMSVIGITADAQKDLWRVVAGCLVAQNIDLTPIDADSTQVADHSRQYVNQAAELWGVPADLYMKELLTTTSTVRGETFIMNHKLATAIDMRDSVTKHMYERLFFYLINCVNQSTDNGADVKNWVGVLDIFGFEDFEINSFEQVCINLANETLQNHYNNYIFKKDMEECRAEGVCVDDVKCPDNSECLRLVADNTGVLGLLDEECRLGTGTDEGFLDKVIHHCTKNPFFDRKATSRGCFIVKHYAGNVTYQIKGFLEKNRDNLKDDFKLLMRTSKNALAAELLPAPVERVGKAPTVGGFFKLQVAELMFLINSTNPHWIRCIKPHPAKKPLHFDGLSVTNQLESSGVLGTVKIRKAGYPVRLYYPQFLARYKILIGSCSPNEPHEVQKEAVRKAMKASKTTSREVQTGKTRVFMKSEAYFVLEKSREEAGLLHRVLIQTHARAVLSQLQKRRLLWEQSIDIIQDEFRDYLRRSEEVRLARRKAKEAMLAAQKKRREEFVGQAELLLRELANECEEEYRNLCKHEQAHKQWLEDKVVLDLEERVAFMNMEARARQELFQELKGFFSQQRPMKAALHLMSLPEIEAHARKKIMNSEDREFSFVLKLFAEHGAALFRAEIERAERRSRRLILRFEDVQFAETIQRMHILPEYIVSLHRVAHPFGPMINAVKEYAAKMQRRAMKRKQNKESNDQISYFTNRHPKDASKLAKELLAIQVGTKTSIDRSYRRNEDKVTHVVSFSSREPWRGVSNVPDLDQVLSGMNVERRSGVAKNRLVKQTANSARPSTTRAVSPQEETAEVRTADIKRAGVNESFTDANDELTFLRMRHMLSRDFKALAKEGHYSGPFVNETNIPDRRTFFSAQDELQLIVITVSQQLVRDLRRLDTFCVNRQIPEQNFITGEWLPYQCVSPRLLAKYPPCTDWKFLTKEKHRLAYATDNYRKELIKIVRSCIQRGARLPLGESVDNDSPVDYVHACYFKLRGNFQACRRCLFPMTAKNTLIQLRLLWPHVQDPKFPDRCKDCNTSAFSEKAMADAAVALPMKSIHMAMSMHTSA